MELKKSINIFKKIWTGNGAYFLHCLNFVNWIMFQVDHFSMWSTGQFLALLAILILALIIFHFF